MWKMEVFSQGVSGESSHDLGAHALKSADSVF
jgi:hypothetical protein